jgi:hypothetical protein
MPHNWRVYSERHKVVAEAQRLARSGEHADHTTIIPLVTSMKGYEAARARLEEPVVLTQLNQLCVLASARARLPRRRV